MLAYYDEEISLRRSDFGRFNWFSQNFTKSSVGGAEKDLGPDSKSNFVLKACRAWRLNGSVPASFSVHPDSMKSRKKFSSGP